MTSESSASLESSRTAGWVLVGVTATVSGGFAVGAAVQTYLLHAGLHESHLTDAASLGLRLFTNLSAVALALLLARWFRLWRRRGSWLVLLIVFISAVGSCYRSLAQWGLHLQLQRSWSDALAEGLAAFLVMVLGMALGLLSEGLVARVRREESRTAIQASRAAAALNALQDEELRVRRDVADGLHGGVQQRLVLIGARIAEVEHQIGAGIPRDEAVTLLAAARAELDQLRAVEVGELSRMLYPDGLELGFVHAVRIMLRRVPASIAVRLEVDPALSEPRHPSTQRRLLMLRVVEEAISNALRHGHASRLELRMRMVDGLAQVEFEDDGTGVAADATLRGLSRLASRLEVDGGSLTIGPAPKLGGTMVTATLPFATRPTSERVAEFGL